jgi:hypothetical protein
MEALENKATSTSTIQQCLRSAKPFVDEHEGMKHDD